jgi:hypothetical protein
MMRITSKFNLKQENKEVGQIQSDSEDGQLSEKSATQQHRPQTPPPSTAPTITSTPSGPSTSSGSRSTPFSAQISTEEEKDAALAKIIEQKAAEMGSTLKDEDLATYMEGFTARVKGNEKRGGVRKEVGKVE